MKHPTILMMALFCIAASTSWVTVERVIDGDTIVLKGGIRVRLIGVDTPELHDPRCPVQPGAVKAMEYTKAQLEGKTVRVELYERDNYGRRLGYVFLEDGTLFNKRLIQLGYGKATDFPHRYLFEFKEAERK